MALRNNYRWDKAKMDELQPMPQPAPPPEPTPGAPRYRVQWLKGQLPRPLRAGEVITFPVSLRNIGGMTWPATGPNPVRLGYHFYQNRQEVSQPLEQRLRTPLPRDVAAGEVVTVDARVALPDEPGNYTLQLDLVHEGITWFKEQRADVLTRWLSVTGDPASRPEPAPAPSPPRPTPEDHSLLPETSILPETSTVPQITDISMTLPRGNRPYEPRSLEQVRYLVINHTAAPPIVPVQAIAQAHVARGYPGIAYDYYIKQNGELLQVSPLDAVVSAEADWSGSGINVCLEGNFDDAPPPAGQLDAAARLCGWLLSRFGLPEQSIVGLRELLQTTSPGNTFLQGPAWKRTLQQRAIAYRHQMTLLPHTDAGLSTAQRNVPQPPIQDITTRLPRDPSGFYRRRPEDIEYIVINHTAAPPDVAIDVIANAFRRKLPGILYQYFIAGDGTIYQTQPLLQVVDGEKPYIARAINVAFAGNFTEDIPTQAQIEAGGALLAWLLTEFPQLTLASIRGVSEFISHGSPGEQWLRGQRWKDLLLNAVATAQHQESSSGIDAGNLQNQVRRLTERNEILNQQLQDLRGENERLHREIEEVRADPRRWQPVVKPPVNDISTTLPRHPSLRYRTRRRQEITHIAVHHTALPSHIGPERIADIHVNEDPDRGKEAWPGIGYHFFVHPDGRIEQTNPLENEAYHVAGHNAYTVGVAFAGSFLNGTVPTPRQLAAGAHLIAWLLQDLRIPLSNVWGHKEFPDNDTVCPGTEWMDGKRWRNTLYGEIVRVQSGEGKKPLHHYLLLGQRPYPGPIADEDLRNAMPYIERFRPTLGFSVDDALQAQYVTIVGGPDGVSTAAEQRLREAGVQVERITGADAEETAHILGRLAQEGRRFQNLREG